MSGSSSTTSTSRREISVTRAFYTRAGRESRFAARAAEFCMFKADISPGRRPASPVSAALRHPCRRPQNRHRRRARYHRPVITRAFAQFRAGCALIALLATVAYANHFRNSFHFDDSHTVESNLFIRDLRNVPRFFTDAGTFSSLPSNQSYRPVVTTTLAVDYALGGGNPVVFHLDTF